MQGRGLCLSDSKADLNVDQPENLKLLGTPAALFASSRNILPALIERGFLALDVFLSRPPRKFKCVGKKLSLLIKGQHFLPQHLIIKGFLALNPPGTLLKVTGKRAEKGSRGYDSETWGIQRSARMGSSILYSQDVLLIFYLMAYPALGYKSLQKESS